MRSSHCVEITYCFNLASRQKSRFLFLFCFLSVRVFHDFYLFRITDGYCNIETCY